MSITTAVAIYAAVVATVAAGFEIFGWIHARKHHLEVQVFHGFVGEPYGNATEAITIKAINRGEHDVRVDGAGFDMQDGSGRSMTQLQIPAGATIPGLLAPRSSGLTYYVADDVRKSGIDLTQPVVGWVSLATGEVIRSLPRPLLKPSRADGDLSSRS